MDPSKHEPSKDDCQINQDSESQENYDESVLGENLDITSSQKPECEDEAFLILKEKADKGSIDAQFEIGCYYEDQKNVQHSCELAVHYYKLAADHGHPQAQAYLAFIYEGGRLDVKQDFEQAFYYYKLAAKHCHPEAMVALGKFYEEGKGGVEKSEKEAFGYYQVAKSFGSSIAWTYLAEAYERGMGTEKSEEKATFCRQRRFQHLKKEADKGSAYAQAVLGGLLEKGEGVEKSMKSAVHYYQLSADQNFPMGLSYLAECFAEGKYVRKSHKNAIHYYKLAVDQGDPYAQLSLAQYLLKEKINEEQAVSSLKGLLQNEQCSFLLLAICENELGKCFEYGTGIEKSAQNALHYYKNAAEHGEYRAQRRLGDAFLKGELELEKSPEKAIEYYQQAANHNDSISLEMIGQCYEKRESVAESPEKAFYYYNLAAEVNLKEGDSSSIYTLARCYEQGRGTKKSLENAIYYYKLAAENGCASYYKVGCCYQKMGGKENAKRAATYFKLAITEKDPFYPIAQFELTSVFEKSFEPESVEEALKYYHLSADKGDSCAQFFIGNLYEWGKSVEHSKEESLKYFKLSADQEYVPALIKLADHYYYSEEEKDYKKSYDYFKKAADHGCASAQCDLGVFYEFGYAVDKDISKAIYYYQLAADQGFSRGLCNLAWCYANGAGVAMSWEEAFKYYKKAADQGSARGQFNVAWHYSVGLGVKESLDRAIEYYELALAQDYRKEETLKNIQACKDAQKNGIERHYAELPCKTLFYPDSRRLDLSPYCKDRRTEVLKNILASSRYLPSYAAKRRLQEAEIPIIRDAMIENPKFAFICTEADIKHLYHSFEEIGYHPESCLRCLEFLYKGEDLCRVLFIGEAA